MSERPKWTYKGIGEGLARWFDSHFITKIEQVLITESADSWRYEANYIDSEGCGVQLATLPKGAKFNPNHYRGMIELDDEVVRLIRKQDEWLEENKRDIIEYERLREKLGL